MTNCDDSLRAKIAKRIADEGPLSFADFMEMALYEPGLGYYVSGKEKWGKEGDYITTLDLSPVFARILARQLLEMWRLLGSPAQFHIVEVGAGRGWLTKEILRAVKDLDAVMAEALHVHLVEKNPEFRSEWESWREEGLCFSELSWHADIRDIEGPVAGCIYSNELFDAMPFHRIVMREEGLREIYTGLDPDAAGSAAVFKDIEGELSTPALTEYFEELGLDIGDGQTTEINLNLKGWIEAASDLLSEGYVITVDYGMPAWRLYEKGRSGTLMCHYRHTLNDDPYRNLGRQDITAHLDFTTLGSVGARAGLETLGYTTQRCFMMGLGVARDLIELTEDSTDDSDAICYNQGIKELIMPGGIGDTMKVMVQYKPRSPAPVGRSSALISLRGFSFKDMVETLK